MEAAETKVSAFDYVKSLTSTIDSAELKPFLIPEIRAALQRAGYTPDTTEAAVHLFFRAEEVTVQ